MLSWLYKWQTLIAGLVGSIAVVSTVAWTLGIEDRRRAREAAAVKNALGAELRLFALRAFEALKDCDRMAQGSANIAPRELDNAVRFPEPVVFTNVADRVGLLGSVASEVVYFYGQVAGIRQEISRLHQYEYSRVLGPNVARQFADALIAACQVIPVILPALEPETKAERELDRKVLRDLSAQITRMTNRRAN